MCETKKIKNKIWKICGEKIQEKYGKLDVVYFQSEMHWSRECLYIMFSKNIDCQKCYNSVFKNHFCNVLSLLIFKCFIEHFPSILWFFLYTAII